MNGKGLSLLSVIFMQRKLLVLVECLIEFFSITVSDLDTKGSARCRRVLVVTERFSIGVNDFDAKKTALWR